MGELRAPARPIRSESERGGGAIRGLGECVWLLLGSGDFVINGEYWIKSRLIAPMECQEILLMASRLQTGGQRYNILVRQSWELELTTLLGTD